MLWRKQGLCKKVASKRLIQGCLPVGPIPMADVVHRLPCCLPRGDVKVAGFATVVSLADRPLALMVLLSTLHMQRGLVSGWPVCPS